VDGYAWIPTITGAQKSRSYEAKYKDYRAGIRWWGTSPIKRSLPQYRGEQSGRPGDNEGTRRPNRQYAAWAVKYRPVIIRPTFHPLLVEQRSGIRRDSLWIGSLFRVPKCSVGSGCCKTAPEELADILA